VFSSSFFEYLDSYMSNKCCILLILSFLSVLSLKISWSLSLFTGSFSEMMYSWTGFIFVFEILLISEIFIIVHQIFKNLFQLFNALNISWVSASAINCHQSKNVITLTSFHSANSFIFIFTLSIKSYKIIKFQINKARLSKYLTKEFSFSAF